MNWRRFRVPGVLAVCLGIGLAVADVALAPTASGFLYVLATVLSGVAVVVGVLSLLGGALEREDRWQPTPAESGYRVPTPGGQLATLEEHERRERLRRLAIDSLVEVRGCTRSDAEAKLAAGSWTDNALAASYLGNDGVRFSLTDRLRATLRRRSVEDRAVEATVAALRDLRTRDRRTGASHR